LACCAAMRFLAAAELGQRAAFFEFFDHGGHGSG
jgi:hypothetical protein